MDIEELRHIARMLRNHQKHHARIIILKIYRPEGPEVWDLVARIGNGPYAEGYLADKLDQFQKDPFGWVLSLDSDNLQRLIDLSGSY